MNKILKRLKSSLSNLRSFTEMIKFIDNYWQPVPSGIPLSNTLFFLPIFHILSPSMLSSIKRQIWDGYDGLNGGGCGDEWVVIVVNIGQLWLKSGRQIVGQTFTQHWCMGWVWGRMFALWGRGQGQAQEGETTSYPIYCNPHSCVHYK